MSAHNLFFYFSSPQSTEQVVSPKRGCPRANGLKEWLDENWFSTIRMEDYANSAGESLRNLARRFKREFDCSPKQYQQNKKLEEAKKFMHETSWSLTDIAYECGYYDSAQFSRIFKAAVGVSPSVYRRGTDKGTGPSVVTSGLTLQGSLAL